MNNCSWKDLLADDNGSYLSYGNEKNIYKIIVCEDNDLELFNVNPVA